MKSGKCVKNGFVLIQVAATVCHLGSEFSGCNATATLEDHDVVFK